MKKLKYLLLVLLLIVGITNVNAKAPETKDREELDNLGVSKKWKITDKNRSNVLNSKYVNADEKIYDFSEVLTDEEIEKLKSAAEEFKKKTKMEIIIVTDSLEYSDDSENETYASDFYDYNDFGLELDEYYSGVLLFRNTYESDPYYNIYTFGKAQLYFSYDRLESTLDRIYDDIHEKNYYSGFNSFISEMDSYYDSGIAPEMENYELDSNGFLKKLPAKYHPPIGIALLVSIIVSCVVIFVLVKKNKMVAKATRAEQYIDNESIKITRKEDNFVTTHTTSYTTSSSSGGGGGFSSSSGSSGGGHSSGGGRHG